MSQAEFARAARLLRLIVQHVQTASLADLRKTDLTQARQALGEFQKVQTRLRRELNHLIPAFRRMPPAADSGKHSDQILRSLMEHIDQHLAQTITLQGCAADLGLNPTYLSALFSRTLGIPFKTYLTEVRVEKARELLSQPRRTIASIAAAVGYRSENRFRVAFKNVTGLSPKTWRETLRMPPRSADR